jgi:hypothetical protein
VTPAAAGVLEHSGEHAETAAHFAKVQEASQIENEVNAAPVHDIAPAPTPTARPEPLEQAPTAEEPTAREVVSEASQSPAPLVGSAPRYDAAPARQEPPSPPAPVKLDWPSDLVQIETDPQKARAPAPHEEEEQAPPPRRARPAQRAVSEEPLVQVETHRREAPADAPAPPSAAPLEQRESANTVGHA